MHLVKVARILLLYLILYNPSKIGYSHNNSYGVFLVRIMEMIWSTISRYIHKADRHCKSQT